MIDYIIMSVLFVGALVGGLYLKREAIRERERRKSAREAEEERRRQVVDEWLRSRVLHTMAQSGQPVSLDQIPDQVRDAIESELFPPAP